MHCTWVVVVVGWWVVGCKKSNNVTVLPLPSLTFLRLFHYLCLGTGEVGHDRKLIYRHCLSLIPAGVLKQPSHPASCSQSNPCLVERNAFLRNSGSFCRDCCFCWKIIQSRGKLAKDLMAFKDAIYCFKLAPVTSWN